VRRYLHRNAGIPLDRIAIVSRGAAAPVADDATPAGRALNRRVEVAILDQE
jgi:outer membrane protein OmpA-like peptidoglycan-associated protein